MAQVRRLQKTVLRGGMTASIPKERAKILRSVRLGLMLTNGALEHVAYTPEEMHPMLPALSY